MLTSGSLRGGYSDIPLMALTFECTISRGYQTTTNLGSNKIVYTTLQNGMAIPCDVSPMSDDLIVTQAGQDEILTHIVHFNPSTDVRPRDVITVTRTNYGDGYVGQSFFIASVLMPSETLSYIRCQARAGKEATS